MIPRTCRLRLDGYRRQWSVILADFLDRLLSAISKATYDSLSTHLHHTVYEWEVCRAFGTCACLRCMPSAD